MHFYPRNTANSFFLFEYLYLQREKDWFKLFMIDQHRLTVTARETTYTSFLQLIDPVNSDP